MLAIKLLEIAKWVDDQDEVIIECDGYELEPYAIEVDEIEGTLIVRCNSPVDSDDDEEVEGDESPFKDDDKAFQDSDVCMVPERPIESLDMNGMDLKEG